MLMWATFATEFPFKRLMLKQLTLNFTEQIASVFPILNWRKMLPFLNRKSNKQPDYLEPDVPEEDLESVSTNVEIYIAY